MKLTKKGSFFELSMFIVVLIVLTTTYFTLSEKHDKFPEGYGVGERQFRLIEAFQKGENVLFYVDQSAKYSLWQSIYDLAINGGNYNANECGRYFGGNVWAEIRKENRLVDVKECYPDDSELKDSLLSFFDEKLQEYATIYSTAIYPNVDTPNVDIPKTYSYELKEISGDLEIAAKNTDDISIEIGKGYVNSLNNQEGFESGTYRLNPAFSASMDYTFSEEYTVAIEEAKQIVGECSIKSDIGKCLKGKAKSSNLECVDDGAENIFYNFFDRYKECSELNDGAVCSFSLGNLEVDVRFKRKFFLDISKSKEGILFELKEEKSVLFRDSVPAEGIYHTDFNNRENGIETNNVRIVLDYRDAPSIESIRASDGTQLSKSILLYKNNNKVMFIDASVENNFRILDTVNLPRKEGVKFCRQSDKQAYVYDYLNKQVRLKNVQYTYAIKYPLLDILPPVKSLDAQDKTKAEGSVIINWTKATWKDGSDVINLEHYKLYCSENEFEKDDDGEIMLGDLKPTAEVFSDTNPDEWKTSLDKCNGEPIRDEKEYYFAVTSATKNAESPAIISKSGISTDDIAPGIIEFALENGDKNTVQSEGGSACIRFTNTIKLLPFSAPQYNEDRDSQNEGTRVKDDERLEYLLHYSKGDKVVNDLDVCTENKCKSVSNSQITAFDSSSSIDDPPDNRFVENTLYCFTLVARDELNNIIKNIQSPYIFNTPEQWNNILPPKITPQKTS